MYKIWWLCTGATKEPGRVEDPSGRIVWEKPGIGRKDFLIMDCNEEFYPVFSDGGLVALLEEDYRVVWRRV